MSDTAVNHLSALQISKWKCANQNHQEKLVVMR
jgi:hypothetical protein